MSLNAPILKKLLRRRWGLEWGLDIELRTNLSNSLENTNLLKNKWPRIVLRRKLKEYKRCISRVEY